MVPTTYHLDNDDVLNLQVQNLYHIHTLHVNQIYFHLYTLYDHDLEELKMDN
jgi:hypothetical protein